MGIQVSGLCAVAELWCLHSSMDGSKQLPAACAYGMGAAAWAAIHRQCVPL